MPLPFSKKKQTGKIVADDFKPLFYIDYTQKLVSLPSLKDRTSINVRYPLLPPYAYAHVYWDDKTQELVYEVQEPKLNDVESEILRLLQLGLEEMINVSFIKAAQAKQITHYLEKNVRAILAELGAKVSEETYKKLMYYIYRDSVGLNEIEPIMNDFYIEDVECNGIGYPVYVVHREYQNLRTTVVYKTKEQLANFVEKLAQKAGRYISYAKPLLDGTLPDGSRVNATFTEDVTTRGPTFTLRKFTKEPWTPINIIQNKTGSAGMFAFFWLAVEYKFNLMVIGETASGKTTFLNSVITFIPPEARIVSIEDTRELNLVHDNWLPSVTRTGFGMPNLVGHQVGEITLFDLLRETFRQNPDYVVLGETRGKEAYVLFQGMASGHPSYSTFHAASIETLVRRLSTPPIELPPALIESLDVIAVITHVKTSNVNVRRVKHVQEVLRVQDAANIQANTPFKWTAATDEVTFTGSSEIFKHIADQIGVSQEVIVEELKVREALLKKLVEKDVHDFKEFSGIINQYYKNKKAVLAKYGVPLTGGISTGTTLKGFSKAKKPAASDTTKPVKSKG